MSTVAILSAQALRARDVARIAQLHEGSDVTSYLVFVPVGSDSLAVVDAINHLSLGDLKDAWSALTDNPDTQSERREAVGGLRESVELLSTLGVDVSGTLTQADPFEELRLAIGEHNITELIVVTEPQAVQDVSGTDWGSRAQDELPIPSLHFYSGTDHVG